VKLQFIYKGNEVFSFTGDDDVWVSTSRSLGTLVLQSASLYAVNPGIASSLGGG
jgi:hypothetical protein